MVIIHQCPSVLSGSAIKSKGLDTFYLLVINDPENFQYHGDALIAEIEKLCSKRLML